MKCLKCNKTISLICNTLFQTSVIGIGYVYFAGFVYQQIYSLMRDAFTMAGLLYFYSFMCLIEIPFVKFVVVETVGKNVG